MNSGSRMVSGQEVSWYAWVGWAMGVVSSLSGCAPKEEGESRPGSPAAVAHPEGLPSIGKWMFDAQSQPAHWLGELYNGKHLREPINVIILDTTAQSADEAHEHLRQNFAAAGYLVREGHSTGYRGYIGGIVYEQLPGGRDRAFSNEPFEMHNNHGRVFGPHPCDGGWLFTAAFSRERLEVLEKVKHHYVSFNQARDDLSQRLDMRTDYKINAFVHLDNALLGDPNFTTGDHDETAILLTTSAP
jgi:hypothetical protein